MPSPWTDAILVAACAVACVVPLWTTPAVPTQDGPGHLYNAWVIARLNDPALGLAEHFRLVPLTPNWGGTAVLVPLLLVVSPDVAEKTFLSLLVAAWVLGAGLLAGRTKGDPVITAAFAGILSHGFLFALGLWAYLAALAASFFLAGLAIHPPTLRRTSLACLAVILIFWMHMAGAVVAAALFGAVGMQHAFGEGGFRAGRAGMASLPAWTLVPLLAWNTALRNAPGIVHPAFREDPRSAWDRLRELGAGGVFRAFEPVDGAIGTALLLLLAALWIARVLDQRPSSPAARLLLASGVLACLGYLFLPWSLGEGAYLPERILPLAFLLGLPWATDAGMRGRRTFRALVLGLLLVAVILRGVQYHRLGALTVRIASCHTSLASRTPFVLNDRVFRGNPVDVGYHLWGRIGIGTGGIALDDYGACLPGLFPVAFREPTARLAEEARRDRRGGAPPGVARLAPCPP